MSCVALPNVDCIAAIAQVHFGEHTRYGYSAYRKKAAVLQAGRVSGDLSAARRAKLIKGAYTPSRFTTVGLPSAALASLCQWSALHDG
jgi:hypothetical protein